MTRLNLEHLTTNFPSLESFALRGTESPAGGGIGLEFFRELQSAGRRAGSDRSDDSPDRSSSSASRQSTPARAEPVRPPRDDRSDNTRRDDPADRDRFDSSAAGSSSVADQSTSQSPNQSTDREAAASANNAETSDRQPTESSEESSTTGADSENATERATRRDEAAEDAADRNTATAVAGGAVQAESSIPLEQAVDTGDPIASQEAADPSEGLSEKNTATAARTPKPAAGVPGASPSGAAGLENAATSTAQSNVAGGDTSSDAEQTTATSPDAATAGNQNSRQSLPNDGRNAAAASPSQSQAPAAEQAPVATADDAQPDEQSAADSDQGQQQDQRSQNRTHRAEGRSFVGGAQAESNAASPARSPLVAGGAATTSPAGDATTGATPEPASPVGDSQGDAASGGSKPSSADPARGATRSSSSGESLAAANEKGSASKFDLSLATKTSEPRGAEQALRARFVQRVAGAVRIAAQRGGHLRLRLSPPELGSLRLDVTLKNGALEAHIRAETSTARSLLLESLPVLRDRLSAQGIRIERFDVDLMDDFSGNSSSPRDQDELSDRSSRQSAAGAGRLRVPNEQPAANETDTPSAQKNQTVDDQRLNVII